MPPRISYLLKSWQRSGSSVLASKDGMTKHLHIYVCGHMTSTVIGIDIYVIKNLEVFLASGTFDLLADCRRTGGS